MNFKKIQILRYLPMNIQKIQLPMKLKKVHYWKFCQKILKKNQLLKIFITK